ncbi:MFS transporter [Actinokineospora diospyrosa]|uniref:Arabinose efflux permease, MFS family n=1 Tax=Actinokineospora diospyrosa TaxID=103728 RepID=A0ABT1I5X3_9PSEU|nr:MFS transporter [Actinokineospora diospyrosa]MCP2268025.1 putative arabinose efflux permease, MFS family [Actinokineospora diospyrosa]
MAHPLRERDFRRLFVGRSLSTISDALVPAALSLAIVLATGSAGALATVLVCALVPKLVLLPLGGVLADRLQPRLVALVADLVRCATQAVVAVEIISGDPRILVIALSQALAGAASACAMPTVSPLVAGVVSAEQRQRANSLMGVSKSVAQLAGPALAGLLIFTVGAGWVFVLDSAAFALSAALLAGLRVRRINDGQPRSSLRRDLTTGWREVASRGWLWSTLVVHAVWNFAAGVLLTLGPLLAVRELGGEQVWVGVLQAGGLGLLVGSLAAGRYRPRNPVLVTNLMLLTYTIPLVLLAVTAPVPWLLVSYFVAIGMLGYLNPTWETVLQSAVPGPVLARVSSYDWLFSLAAQPLGYAMAPVVASAWGSATPLFVAAGLVALACVGVTAVPAVRAFRMPEPEPTSLVPVLAKEA